MKKPKFQSPTGMHDILPADQEYYHKIFSTCKDVADFYGFGKIDTPILESADLFLRGLGMTTDVVSKQMYTFKTKGENLVALRPEGTAPVARSFNEHGMFNLPRPIKLWYWGPFFRYENPQAGRFRQFWQFGFEEFGEQSPVIDTQIIQIFYDVLSDLKLKNLVIELNSIGDSQCRPYYKKLLISYLKSRESSLCVDCRRRLRENPLRILDCKEEKCQRVRAQAPQIIDHLCEECHRHFKELLEFLEELELPYRLSPYLVRGLDYYTKTVFEIFTDSIPEKQVKSESDQVKTDNPAGIEEPKEEKLSGIALVGGGRYDSLVKMLGGKDTPACGAAAGVERIVGLMKARDIKIQEAAKPVVFLSQIGSLAKRKSLKVFEEFRKNKINIAESFGKDSLKAQLKFADKLETRYTLILGQKEALEGTIVIRDMVTGRQDTVKMADIIEEIKKRIKKGN